MSFPFPSAAHRRPFFLLWLLVNSGGWLALAGLFALLFALLDGFGFSDPPPYLYGLILALSGCLLGALQWLVLRERFPVSRRRWVLATAIGLFVGGLLSPWANLLDLYIFTSPPTVPNLEWDSLIVGAIIGLAIGICQAAVWWPKVPRALGWLVANVVGWSAGFFLADVIRYLLKITSNGGPALLLQQGVEGAFVGLATGAILLWLTIGGGRSRAWRS